MEILLFLFVSFLAVAPNFWAYLRTPEGYFFSGINANVYYPDVEGVYFPAMFNSSRGEFLYQNPFDSSSKSVFHLPFYFFLGKIVRIFSLPIELVYHSATFVLSFVYLLFVFKFLKHFFKDIGRLLLAFGLVNFGGLFFFRSADGIGIFSYSIPHLVLSEVAFLTCIRYLLLIAIKQPFPRFAFLFWSIILSVIHPWMAMTMIATSLILSLALRDKNKINFRFLVVALFLFGISLPFIFYYGVNLPWASDNLSSSPFILILLYGLFLPVAIIGIWRVVPRKSNTPFIFLVVLVIVQVIFIHLPLPFAKRYVEGLFLPLAVFSVVAIDWFISRIKLGWSSNIVYVNFFIYLSLGVIANYLLLFIWLPNAYVYKPIGEKEGMVFLDENSKPDDRIFSLPISGTYIPGYADVKIFVGQNSQTPDFERKSRIVEAYYSGELAIRERNLILISENICFVYVGPFEKRINKINFANENFLIPIFENESVVIYKTLWCE